MTDFLTKLKEIVDSYELSTKQKYMILSDLIIREYNKNNNDNLRRINDL